MIAPAAAQAGGHHACELARGSERLRVHVGGPTSPAAPELFPPKTRQNLPYRECALGVLALLRSARTAGDRPCPCHVRWTLRRYCYPAIRCGGIVIGNPARNQAVITSHPLLCPDTMARCPRGAWGPRRPAAGDRGWIGIRGGGISGGALRGRRRGACPVCGV